MEYRRLGKTGLKVSELSFGSWITFGNQIDNSVSERLMDIAYDHGVNFFVSKVGENNSVSKIFHRVVAETDTIITLSAIFLCFPVTTERKTIKASSLN